MTTQKKTRTLELDLSQLPDWVEKADDNTLLEVFVIGVKVKDSIAINITENPELIKDALNEELKPVHERINQMSNRFSSVQNEFTTSLTTMQLDATKLNNCLVSEVQSVANKVPALDSLCSKMNDIVKPVKTEVHELAQRLSKTSIQGSLAEKDVCSILKDNFPTHTINHVGPEGRKADIEITSPTGQNYLVEVKDRKSQIPTTEIERFKKEVRENNAKVGILFSLRSGVAVLGARFTIKYEDDQYYIYVPNVLPDQQHWVVWAVILADQLACLNQGLTDTQTDMVAELLKEFQDNMERSKTCQTQLKSLKKSVEQLESNMIPLLKVIENAKTKLNSALNKSS